MKAVILAGGMGSRLASYLKDIPKPMIKIMGRPVLQHQVENLKKSGITEIIMVIGYRGDKIKNYFADGHRFEVSIDYFEEIEPLGTAGALFYLKNRLPENFILLYGDLIFNVDFKRLLNFHHKSQASATVVVHPNDHPYDSDIALVDGSGRICGLLLKDRPRPENYSNCVSAGIFVFNQAITRYVAENKKQDLEKELLFNIIAAERILAYKTAEYIKDIGTPERYHQVEKHLHEGIVAKKSLYNKQKAIFLDRDGTINEYVGLVTSPQQLEISSDIYRAVKMINNSEFLAIVITNQPVVARNLCTIKEVENIHRHLETMLGEKGGYLDDIFYCPHHPEQGYPEENPAYKIQCNCRKPGIALLEKAARRYNIDLSQSFIIGDSSTDIQTGINAGMKTILLSTGLAGRDNKYKVHPDYQAANLLSAITQIMNSRD